MGSEMCIRDRCTYTAPTRQSVTSATQFAIGDNLLVYNAQDTAVDASGTEAKNAAECSITVTVTDNEVPVIDQYGRLFIPDFLMVQAGQTVRFTNSEDDLHTVHVKDEAGESLINVATINGSRYDFLVEKPGEYVVICNTHTEMFADILAFDTPYFVMAEADGSFSLDGVVPGTYTVVVLYGGERTEREVQLVAGPNQLDLTG